MSVIYPRIAIIGCGLIGGSIARAAKAVGAAGDVVLFDASPEVRARVREIGFGDRVTDTAAEAVSDADLVIIATPVLTIGAVTREIADHLKPGATLSDVGSVKHAAAQAMSGHAPEDVFVVPAHPIAGTEHSGPDAGFAELFRNRWTLITPSEARKDDAAYQTAVTTLVAFWEALGANVELMDERRHDLVLAVTSHLPHLIAYTIVGSANDLENVTESEVMKFSAGGFRDFTRIAASDPTMWRDVFLTNKEAVLEMLGRFTEDLQTLSRAIRWGEGDKLHEHFTRTRALRRGLIELGQESAEPNFGRKN